MAPDRPNAPFELAAALDTLDQLVAGHIARARAPSLPLTPAVMRAAICRWREDGVSGPKVSARWLLLRAAVSRAVAEDLLGPNPAGMPGPPARRGSGRAVRRE